MTEDKTVSKSTYVMCLKRHILEKSMQIVFEIGRKDSQMIDKLEGIEKLQPHEN